MEVSVADLYWFEAIVATLMLPFCAIALNNSFRDQLEWLHPDSHTPGSYSFLPVVFLLARRNLNHET